MVEIRTLQPSVKVRSMKTLKLPDHSPTAEALMDWRKRPRGAMHGPKLRIPRTIPGTSQGRRRKFNVVRRPRRDWLPPTPQPTPCVIWQGALDRDGYGRITKFLTDGTRRQLGVHRHIMELYLGRHLETHEIVLHACDNRVCYAVAHLSIGSTQDNTADMVAKGRNSRPPVNIYHGAAHPMSKVSDDLVEYARALYARGGYTQVQMAEILGLSKSQTQRILRREGRIPEKPITNPADPRARKEGSIRWTREQKKAAAEAKAKQLPYR